MCETSCVKVNGDEDITLSPCELLDQNGPGDIRLTTVTLSRMGFAIPWFIKYLEGTESAPNDFPAIGRTYQASRDSAGRVYLKDTRNGGFINMVGYSLAEIPIVLAEIKEKINPGL